MMLSSVYSILTWEIINDVKRQRSLHNQTFEKMENIT